MGALVGELAVGWERAVERTAGRCAVRVVWMEMDRGERPRGGKRSGRVGVSARFPARTCCWFGLRGRSALGYLAAY